MRRLPPTADELRAFATESHWLESFIRPISGTAPQKTPDDWQHDGPERLARMRALLALLGDPQDRYQTLHVVGTSGKGSVCTYLGAMLQAAGLRTGVHTTPYLQTPVEKLQIDGEYASPADFVALVERFRSLLGLSQEHAPVPSGPFEGLAYPALWVALTYLYFAMQRVDVAVIEASVGGRWDWTNTLQPEVATITTVGPDHLPTLGPTLADVAWHKAGAIKPGTVAVTGAPPQEREAIEREAALKGAPLLRLGEEFAIEVRGCSAAGTRFDFIDRRQPERSLYNLETGMLGRYQAFNAGVAIAAARAYAERHGTPTDTAIRDGLRTARIAGRMELIQRSPDVLLDGAHNPQKAAALAEALAEIFPERRLIVVLGALSNKDAAGIIRPLAQQARQFVVTAPHVLGKPAAEPERIAAQARALGLPASEGGEPDAALERALALAGPGDLVVVTGSLYLVGEARRRWIADETVLATGSAFPEHAA